jgi:hypothetical protein
LVVKEGIIRKLPSRHLIEGNQEEGADRIPDSTMKPMRSEKFTYNHLRVYSCPNEYMYW